MAISPMKDTKQKQSPVSSSAKLKQKVWENKTKLVKMRLMGLLADKMDQEESVNIDQQIICYPPKEKPTDDLPKCDGVSSSVMKRAPKEKPTDDLPKCNGVSSSVMKRAPKKKPTDDLPTGKGVLSSAMKRARAIEAKANRTLRVPSFCKRMLRSHVTLGYWLGLPIDFCREHLPRHDETVVLVDENEKEYDSNYLVEKKGLSGGWRGFSKAHKLVEEDCLVFQLIEPCKFKIHIVRARTLTKVNAVKRPREETLTEVYASKKPRKETLTEVNAAQKPREEKLTVVNATKSSGKDTLTEVNAAECLLNLHAEPVEPVKMEENQLEEAVADNNRKKDSRALTSEPAADHSDISIENYDPDEIPNSITFSDSFLHFEDVKSFDDFKVQYDGLILDSKIPTDLRTKYYNLCLSQNMFLHENLIKGLNSYLVAGMISETINTADAIKAAKFSMDPSYIKSWDTTLKAFEDLGLAVGFLRARINKLICISCESRLAIESKRNERIMAEDEMKNLKSKLSDVEMRIVNLDAEIDGLKDFSMRSSWLSLRG